MVGEGNACVITFNQQEKPDLQDLCERRKI